MRQRQTFWDRALCVGNSSELLLYGPRTAKAYAKVTPLRDELEQEIVKSIPVRRRILRMLRDYGGYSFQDACGIVQRMKLGPTYCDLARFGYDRIYRAADADTETYSNAMDSGLSEPFEPCGSPREAYERYGAAA